MPPPTRGEARGGEAELDRAGNPRQGPDRGVAVGRQHRIRPLDVGLHVGNLGSQLPVPPPAHIVGSSSRHRLVAQVNEGEERVASRAGYALAEREQPTQRETARQDRRLAQGVKPGDRQVEPSELRRVPGRGNRQLRRGADQPPTSRVGDVVHPVERGGERNAAPVLVVPQGVDQGRVARGEERQEIDVARGNVTEVVLLDVPGTESVSQRERGERGEPVHQGRIDPDCPGLVVEVVAILRPGAGDEREAGGEHIGLR